MKTPATNIENTPPQRLTTSGYPLTLKVGTALNKSRLLMIFLIYNLYNKTPL